MSLITTKILPNKATHRWGEVNSKGNVDEFGFAKPDCKSFEFAIQSGLLILKHVCVCDTRPRTHMHIDM